ncbi:MAG: RNA-binding S4 domain-containing protein [Gemmatimonadaceae bacterium]|nr:RNA-binding S4 domain-containing protein [Gemmatimonadaceae bacterium]
MDKWLWAARFFKTRAQASEAVGGGKVEVGGERVKPARALRAGDVVRIRLGPYEYVVTVLSVSDKRGPAAVARTLYEETVESRERRERLAWNLHHAAPVIEPGRGRPTKKDRRELDRTRRR